MQRVAIATALLCLGSVGCLKNDVKYWEETDGKFTLKLPYYGNHDLDEKSTKYTRAIVSIHGKTGSAKNHYNVAADLARTSGVSETTLIVAPHFIYTDENLDAPLYRFQENDIFYWTSGWTSGNLSGDLKSHGRPFRASSFSIMDNILLRLDNNDFFPNISKIIVVGHSGGGQFVNRYAPINRVHPFLSASVRYIILNPGTVMYVSSKRRVAGSLSTFAVPSASELNGCAEYNNYLLGLEGKNEYASSTPDSVIKDNFRRDIVFLVGSVDSNVNDSTMPKTCGANIQGAHRLEKAKIYFNHIAEELGFNLPFSIVPGVGHDASGMYRSSCGKKYILDSSDTCTLQTSAFTN